MVCFYAAVLGCVLMADSVQVEGENVKIGVDLMVGPIPVQDMLTKKPRPTRSFYLQCALMVQDTSSEKSIEFRGWGSNPAKALAFLKDDLGNQYKVADLGATSQFPGKIKTVSVSPGKGVVELLPFQMPGAKASSFTLTLKGQNVGEDRDLVVQFTRASIKDPMGAMKPEKGEKVRGQEEEPRRPQAGGATAEPQRTKEALDKAGWRVWTSANGKYKIEARLLRAESGNVILRKNDGTEIEVAEVNLSKEDVDWVKSEKWKTSP
jgi:hypothetical protein